MQSWIIKLVKFKFLLESRFTSACEIRQNVQWLRYRDITVFKMAVPHHLNFRNFSLYSRDLCLSVILLSSSKFCINQTIYGAGIYPKDYSLSPFAILEGLFTPSVVDALEFMPCLFVLDAPVICLPPISSCIAVHAYSLLYNKEGELLIEADRQHEPIYHPHSTAQMRLLGSSKKYCQKHLASKCPMWAPGL